MLKLKCTPFSLSNNENHNWGSFFKDPAPPPQQKLAIIFPHISKEGYFKVLLTFFVDFSSVLSCHGFIFLFSVLSLGEKWRCFRLIPSQNGWSLKVLEKINI